ncbi:target of EGR1 protein 1-like [Mya arenaria]|uniref:target of EGR1 protein 1-like n=1 Tax=Mya arenaria TaxID=6604 RepID=UPI0022E37B47|nr:target of EGR1 protein 1-like [Mya arenaria]
MASFSRVPMVDVHSDNMSEVWPSIIMAMSNADFVAVDTELSGLGDRRRLNAKAIEERYSNICEVAKTRSVLSLGLSCFRGMTSSNLNSQSQASSYIVQTFNILFLCEDDFLVEPKSLKFLVQHGFDFNKQFAKGLSYYRGLDKEKDCSFKTPRHLFSELLSMKVPVVVHNGLVDLIFLYENLYTSLPASSATFLADLVDMFPGGLLDTKYITEFEHLMPASYLEYVFRKCQKDQCGDEVGSCVIHHPHFPPSYKHVTYRDCSLKPAYNIADNPAAYRNGLCPSFAGHGWCAKEKFCPKSHDIDLVIDMDKYTEGKKSRKRKRRQENKGKRAAIDQSQDELAADDNAFREKHAALKQSKDTSLSDDSENESSETNRIEAEDTENNAKKVSEEEIMKMLKEKSLNQSNDVNGGHRAGYDAFMTGFIFAVYKRRYCNGESRDHVQDWKNKLYLCGKNYPLVVTKSSFSKQSKHHLEKMSRIHRTVV